MSEYEWANTLLKNPGSVLKKNYLNSIRCKGCKSDKDWRVSIDEDGLEPRIVIDCRNSECGGWRHSLPLGKDFSKLGFGNYKERQEIDESGTQEPR
jgi:hypothetical protein